MCIPRSSISASRSAVRATSSTSAAKSASLIAPRTRSKRAAMAARNCSVRSDIGTCWRARANGPACIVGWTTLRRIVALSALTGGDSGQRTPDRWHRTLLRYEGAKNGRDRAYAPRAEPARAGSTSRRAADPLHPMPGSPQKLTIDRSDAFAGPPFGGWHLPRCCSAKLLKSRREGAPNEVGHPPGLPARSGPAACHVVVQRVLARERPQGHRQLVTSVRRECAVRADSRGYSDCPAGSRGKALCRDYPTPMPRSRR